MRIAAYFKQRGIAPVVAVLVILAIGIAGYFSFDHLRSGSQDALSTDGVVFEVVDAAHREFDGAPALALSFSLPLDARADVGKFVQVLEMPPGPNQPKVVAPEDQSEVDEEYSSHNDAKLGTST